MYDPFHESRNENGEINLYAAFTHDMGGRTLTFTELGRIQEYFNSFLFPISSRQVAALAIATAWTLIDKD